MTESWTTTLAVGLLITFAAAALGLRQMLMSPKAQNYPAAPFYVRLAMFAWMVALAYRGAEILLGLGGPAPERFRGGAVLTAALLATYQGAMLVHILRQRLPARIWGRVNKALDLACCGRAEAVRRERARNGGPSDARPAIAAVAELQLAGATVSPTSKRLKGVIAVGPGEGPASLH